jgi:hypothetical protein
MNYVALLKNIWPFAKKRLTKGKWFEDEDEWPGLLTAIKYTYWKIWPYDWRPGEVWRRIKGFFWYRYTTTKPRTLKYHTWCDRYVLLPHTMFEILSQFLERECSPGYVEWYGSMPHMVEVNGEQVNVRDEMQAIYDWWHNDYNKAYPEECDRLWEITSKHHPIYLFSNNDKHESATYSYDPKFETEEDERIYKECIDELNRLEREMEKQQIEMMHRLVNCTPYMWT